MKRITAILIAALVLSGYSVTADAYAPSGDSADDATTVTDSETLKGDLDEDGEVTSSDALIALRISIGFEDQTEENLTIADLDDDGEITSSDALKILRMSIGLDDPEEVKEEPVTGNWTYKVSDAVYTNVFLGEDGTAQISGSNYKSTMIGSWRKEDTKVIITLYGADNSYTYTNGTLVSDKGSSIVYVRGTTVVVKDLDPAAVKGEWTYKVSDSVYTNMYLEADGTVQQSSSSTQNTAIGTWRTQGSSAVIVTLYGSDDSYQFIDDTLVSDSDSAVVYVRGITSVKSDLVNGYWTFCLNKFAYTNLYLRDDGSAQISGISLREPINCKWYIYGKSVVISINGQDNVFTFTDNKLVNENDTSVVFVRGTTEAPKSDDPSLAVGSWIFRPNENEEMSMLIAEDNTVQLRSSYDPTTYEATWRIDGDMLVINYMGTDNSFKYFDGMLVNLNNTSMVYERVTEQ